MNWTETVQLFTKESGTAWAHVNSHTCDLEKMNGVAENEWSCNIGMSLIRGMGELVGRLFNEEAKSPQTLLVQDGVYKDWTRNLWMAREVSWMSLIKRLDERENSSQSAKK